jgi:phosphotriesterase-related protein
MAIQTVCGEIPVEKLGVTLAHEHLLIDLRALVDEPQTDKDVFYEKLRLDNRYQVYNDPYKIKDNAVIDNFEIAVRELEIFKAAGGDTVVDVTLDEIGRDPMALKALSERTGVQIVMGCGRYIDGALNEKLRSMTEKELAEEMIKDVTVGARGTGVKAGVIGEIGTSAVITPTERKNLTAAGIAAAETGKAIHVHTALYQDNGIEVVETLKKQNVPAEKIAIDHVDVLLREDYLLKLLDMGARVEFDNFGKEFYISPRSGGLLTSRFAYDLERAQLIAKLVKKGYLSQILITNDICLKSMLCAYGGNGYAHTLKTVKDMLLDEGLSEAQFQTLVVDNVAEFLK